MTVSFDAEFRSSRAMLILRGQSPQRSIELAEMGWDAGIRLVEVPAPDAAGLESLQAVIAASAERRMPVGAGTITTPQLLDTVVDAGAQFTVAPGWTEAVSTRSRELGIPHLPGVATATDIQHATAAGHTWVKAFPASLLGADWITAMKGPFSDVHFVATGGITPANAADYLRAGADAVAIGAAIATATHAELRDLAQRPA